MAEGHGHLSASTFLVQLPEAFFYRCLSCGAYIADAEQSPMSYLDTESRIMDPPLPAVRVNEEPARFVRFGPLTAAPVHCSRCASWLGWKILEYPFDSRFVNPGQYILMTDKIHLLP